MKSYKDTIIKKDIPEGTSMKLEEHDIFENFPIHRHEYYEIEYVRSGSGTIIINGAPHKFSAGTAWLSTTTDFHEILIEDKATIVNLCFRIDWIETEILNSLSHGTTIQNFDEKTIDRFLREYESSQYGTTMYLKHSLSCMLIDFARVIDAQETKNTYSKFSHPIGEALRYIQSHFSENIALNGVAAQVGLSASYFSTRFHNELNISFQSYLVKIRLETAAKFLTSTQYAVTDICYLTGFNDYANFTKAFKKRYTMTPTQYRKEKYLKLL